MKRPSVGSGLEVNLSVSLANQTVNVASVSGLNLIEERDQDRSAGLDYDVINGPGLYYIASTLGGQTRTDFTTSPLAQYFVE